MSIIQRSPEDEARALATSLAHQILAGLVRLPIEPVSLTIPISAGAWALTVSVRPAIPTDDEDGPVLARCKRDVLSALATAPHGHPLTTPSILSEMERRGFIHSEKTVKRALADMVRAGQLLSSRRSPRGYSLPQVLTTSS